MSVLYLTRREGETLLIGKNISITIDQGGHQVRLKIVAPESVTVIRSELNRVICPGCNKEFEKIRKNKRFCSEKCSAKMRMRHKRAAKASAK